jgi:hypothetical protein
MGRIKMNSDKTRTTSNRKLIKTHLSFSSCLSIIGFISSTIAAEVKEIPRKPK